MPPTANPNHARSSDPPSGPSGTAVCCSGGGIRAAAFSLGGLQALGDAKELARVDHLTAVSGGSYIATAYSVAAADLARKAEPKAGVPRPRAGRIQKLTNPLLSPGERAALSRTRAPSNGQGERHKEAAGQGIVMGPYALGSPEERHLRADSRYMLPNPAVGLRGMLFLLFGIVQNLIILLPIVFVASHVGGQLLRLTSGRALESGGPLRLGWGPYVAIGLLVAAGLVFAADSAVAAFRTLPRTFRQIDTRLTFWLALAAGIAAAVLVALPAALYGLNRLALYHTGWLPSLLHDLGFAPAGQCNAIAAAGTHTGPALCQTTVDYVMTNPAPPPAFTGSTSGNTIAGSGLLAALLAVLTRLTIGRTAANDAGKVTAADLERTGDKLLKTKTGTKIAMAVRHYLTPWAGSAVIVGVFVVLVLRWSLDGALRTFASEWLPILIAAALGVIAKLLISVNRTSMHRFYKERLSSAYGVTRRDALVTDPNAADSTDVMAPDPSIAISSLGEAAGDHDLPEGYGRPELVICAAANIRGSGVPTGRGAMSFTFTPHSSGLALGRRAAGAPDADSRGRARRAVTAEYEDYSGRHVLGLFDMVAMSGAALSPLMGKLTRPSLRILLTMANVRLGVWLPNPAVIAPDVQSAHAKPVALRQARMAAGRLMQRKPWYRRLILNLWQPGALALVKEMVGSCRIDGRWLYITDGGGYENLGLVEALRRKPAEVFCFDASGDTPGSFSTLGQAIALARTELSVNVDLNPRASADREGGALPYVVGTATYPDGSQASIWYVKAMLTPGAPWDVQAYAMGHPKFPHDSTGQQLYDDPEFEAYRSLGHDAVTRVLAVRKHPGSIDLAGEGRDRVGEGTRVKVADRLKQ